jgi:hypothetical protein
VFGGAAGQGEISSIVNHDIRLRTDIRNNKTKEMALKNMGK